ncbi:hypothetical protein OROGR_022956 [Orobanche gracilis]
MDHFTTKTTTTCGLLLFFFLLISSLYVFHSSFDKTMYSSGYLYAPVVPLVLVLLLVAVLIVFTVRTTIVTWITVMVLLAFVGKRRRVLVKEERKITSDVAMYLARIVVGGRIVVAVAACTTIFGLLITMASMNGTKYSLFFRFGL